MARKTLSIGITVNLENYENLRLDVEGEVGDDGDAEELISFLDGMLARLGHGDQVTAERVEAYRKRVLAFPKAVVTAVPGPVRREEEAAPAAVRAHPGQAAAGKAPLPGEPVPAGSLQEPPVPREEKPATVRTSPEVKVPKPAATKAPAAPPAAPAVRAPEPRRVAAPQPPKEPAKEVVKEPVKEPAKPERPTIAEGEVACEGCGLSITRNQEKLSRLLTGKSLCKRCMNP